jgi:hypothetical protein
MVLPCTTTPRDLQLDRTLVTEVERVTQDAQADVRDSVLGDQAVAVVFRGYIREWLACTKTSCVTSLAPPPVSSNMPRAILLAHRAGTVRRLLPRRAQRRAAACPGSSTPGFEEAT